MGCDANRYFHQSPNRGEVVDFILNGLNRNVDEIEIKKIANVKHVISSEVDIDTIRNTCSGTGRIKIRLNEGENKYDVMNNFKKLGVQISDHKIEAFKNT